MSESKSYTIQECLYSDAEIAAKGINPVGSLLLRNVTQALLDQSSDGALCAMQDRLRELDVDALVESATRLVLQEIEQRSKQETTTIQTLILSKDKFDSLDAARRWVKEHDFKVEFEGKGPDETETSFRFRQLSPSDFQSGSFRTIELADGVKAVIGRRKEQQRSVKLMPVQKTDEDRNIVFGVVLEPNSVDAQSDTIKPAEIERAAHLWLARFQDRGLMHRRIINGKIEIYESYIAPVNMSFRGQKVKKGTWLLMLHVLDEALWASIKSGEMRGFSMGGFARRVKV